MLMQLLCADVRAAADGPCGRILSTIFLDANCKDVRNYRIVHALHARLGWRVLPRYLTYRSRVRFSIDIDHRAVIGPGFVLRHGVGVVVGRDVRAGSRLSLHQGATQPVLGDNVSVLTGACVFGPVSIGSNAVIGAGALVFTDIPAATVVLQKRQTLLRPAGTPAVDCLGESPAAHAAERAAEACGGPFAGGEEAGHA